MKKRCLFVGFLLCLVVSLVSCNFLAKAFVDSVTTINAKYTELSSGGIKITGLTDGFVQPEVIGLAKEDGDKCATLTFSAPNKEGLMSCNELPIEFFKVSVEPGKRSVHASSKYIGTWQAIIPDPEGFKNLYLDLKDNFECCIQLGIDDKVDVKTRTGSILRGSVMSDSTTNTYTLHSFTGTGYVNSIRRFVTTLVKREQDNSHILVANFKLRNMVYATQVFKLLHEEGRKKIYVGYGNFSKDKLGGVEISLEIEDGNFKLEIPQGAKLHKKFNE